MKRMFAMAVCGILTFHSTQAQVSLCLGTAVELAAPDSLTNVIWSNGDSSSVTTVSAIGIFTYSGLSDSLIVNDTIEVVSGAVPMMPSIQDSSVCDGIEYQPFANLDAQTMWSWTSDNPAVGEGLLSEGEGLGLTFIAEAGDESEIGNFSLVGESSDGCTDTVFWLVEVLPAPQLNPIQLESACTGDVVEVNLESCCTNGLDQIIEYEWIASINQENVESGAGNLISFVSDLAGEYALDVVATLGQCSAEVSFDLFTFPYPEFSVDTVIFACAGDQVVIECDLALSDLVSTWEWEISNSDAVANEEVNANVLTLTAINADAAVLELATISVEANFNGCIVADEMELTVHSLPVVASLENIEVCGGNEIQFPQLNSVGASAVDVEWGMGENGVLPLLTGFDVLPAGVVAPNASTTQMDFVTLVPVSSGCTGAQTILEVSVAPTPELLAPAIDSVLCPGDSWSYVFQDGEDGIVPASTFVTWNVDGIESGVVELPEGSSNGLVDLGAIDHSEAELTPIQLEINASSGLCFSSELILELLLEPALNPSLEGDFVACEGESVLLSANEPSGRPTQFDWFAEDVLFHQGNVYWGPLPSAGLIELSAEDLETGCSFSLTEEVQVDNPVAYSFTALGPLQFCLGESATLEIDTQHDVAWSTGQSSMAINVTETGSYSAVVSSGECSEMIGPFYVEVLDLPEVQLLGQSEACEGEELHYALEGDGLVRWFVDGTLASLGSPEFEITAQADVWIGASLEASNGCLTFDSIQTAVESEVQFSIPDYIQRCPEDSVTIVESEWMPGWMWSGMVESEEGSIVLPPEVEGMVFISTDPMLNCVWTDSAEVQSLNIPPLDIVGNEEICRGGTSLFETGIPVLNPTWEVEGGVAEFLGGYLQVSQIADSVTSILVGVQGESLETGCLAQGALEIEVVGALPEIVEVEDLGFGVFVFPVDMSIIRWGVTDNLTGTELVVQQSAHLFSFEQYESSQYGKWVDYGSSPNCLRRANLQDVLMTPLHQVSDLTIYPNPMDNSVVLEWGRSEWNFDVKLFDAQGREVRQFPNVISGSILELHDLPPSLYVVQCNHNGRIVHSAKIEKR